jgi:hypothetical protein
MATRRPLGRNLVAIVMLLMAEFQQDVTMTAPARHAPVLDVPPSATGYISTP